MNADRIKEIQQKTAYPESISVYKALLQVWNECEQNQLTHPAPPQSGVVDIYEERAHHSHTATSLDTAPPQSAEEWKEFVKHTSNHIGNNTALKWYSQWHMKERPIYQKQLISGYVQESIYAYFHNINNKTPKPRNEPPPKLGAEEWIRNSVYGQELDEDEIKALVAIINEYNQYAK